jgi:2-oxoglutarate ferredoxin oxidoreductase subunit alpha
MTAEDLDPRLRPLQGRGRRRHPWRTLPGTHPTRGSYFTRGTTRDPYARYSERGPDYVYNVERLLKKATAATLVPPPVPRPAARRTRLGVIFFGSTSPAMHEALDVLGQGIHLDALRLRAFPFSPSVREFIAAHETVFVVEQNRDAQMRHADQRAGDPAGQAARAALRRHADHRALHHPIHHRPRARGAVAAEAA